LTLCLLHLLEKLRVQHFKSRNANVTDG
jgi:hypothetical protein